MINIEEGGDKSDEENCGKENKTLHNERISEKDAKNREQLKKDDKNPLDNIVHNYGNKKRLYKLSGYPMSEF